MPGRQCAIQGALAHTKRPAFVRGFKSGDNLIPGIAASTGNHPGLLRCTSDFRYAAYLLRPLTSAAGGRPLEFPRLILSGLGSMLALSDNQLAAVMTAAGNLPAEKRGVFLERVVARLSLYPRFTAAEFADTVHLALRGLIQEKSAA
jgi:hypothetical protein